MEITRGDNKTFKFKRTTKEGKVITEVPDEMYITLKKNSGITKALFQKKLSNNSIIYDGNTNYYSFEIVPEDTDSLVYGKYNFDIEIIKNNKKRTIHKGTLKVTEEYTFTANEVD